MSRRVGIWAGRRQYELENDFRIRLYGNGGNSEQIKLVPCPNMDTPITDVGLVYLKGLTNLKSLNVQDTQVTGAGYLELKTTLPNCKIIK